MKIKAIALAALMAAGLSAPAFAMTTGVTNTDTHSVIDGNLITCETIQTNQWGYIDASAYANKSELNLSSQKQVSVDGVLRIGYLNGSLNGTASASTTFSGSLENSGSNSHQLTYFSVSDTQHNYFNGIQSQTQDSHTVSAFTNP